MELTVANVSTVNVTGNVSGLGADAHSAVATAGPIAVQHAGPLGAQHAGPLGAPQAIGTAATTTIGTLAKEIIANGSMVVAIFPAAATAGVLAQAVAT